MNFDEKRKILGDLLASDMSFSILKSLSVKEMYRAEITRALTHRVSLTTHHLKKFEKLGILTTIEKPVKITVIRKYHSIDPKYLKKINNLIENNEDC